MLSIGLIVVFSAFLTHTAVGQNAGECLLPNQQRGHCVPVTSCRPTYEFLQKARTENRSISQADQRHLQQLYCGIIKQVVHVCCPVLDIQLNPQGLEILKNQTSCGLYTTTKVANGQEAALSGYPWMALLLYNDKNDPIKCGGTLITERYVLTAAHCIKENLYQVRLGEHRLSTKIDCLADGKTCAPPSEDVGIEETLKHPDYVRYSDDIALIRLNRTILYETKYHIKPICLPIYDDLRGKSLEEYVISGWGKTEKAPLSDVLKVALVPLVERSKCQEILKEFHLRRALTIGQICAGNRNLTDVCQGDSGGPLGYKESYDGRPRFVQFGVNSFGAKLCGDGDAPNVYTNVSQYMPWITATIRP